MITVSYSKFQFQHFQTHNHKAMSYEAKKIHQLAYTLEHKLIQNNDRRNRITDGVRVPYLRNPRLFFIVIWMYPANDEYKYIVCYQHTQRPNHCLYL